MRLASSLIGASLLMGFAVASDGAPTPFRSRLVGAWEGFMTFGESSYGVNIWFDDTETPSGRLQIVGVSSDRNPLTDIEIDGAHVRFSMASQPPQVFDGALTDGRMTGVVTFAGRSERFELRRATP